MTVGNTALFLSWAIALTLLNNWRSTKSTRILRWGDVIHTAFSMDFSTAFSRGTQLAKSTPQGRLWRPMMWIFFKISFSSLLQPMAIIIYPSGAIAPLKRGRTWRTALWIPTGNKFWSLCAKRSCRSFGAILTDLGRLLLGLFAWGKDAENGGRSAKSSSGK